MHLWEQRADDGLSSLTLAISSHQPPLPCACVSEGKARDARAVSLHACVSVSRSLSLPLSLSVSSSMPVDLSVFFLLPSLLHVLIASYFNKPMKMVAVNNANYYL